MCARGRHNDCETSLQCLGMRIDGGMADQVVGDAFMRSPLNEGVDLELGALVGPLGWGGV